MLPITYTLTQSTQWIETLHRQLPSTLADNTLTLLPEVGTGTIRVFEIQPGLYVTYIDVQLNRPVQLHRVPASSNDHFIVNFHISQTTILKETEHNSYQLGLSNQSVLLSSAMTQTKLSLPTHQPIHVFNITFSKAWFETNLQENNSTLSHLLSQEVGIYLFENLDYTLSQTIAGFRAQPEQFSKINLFARVLQILSHFFDKVENRAHTQSKSIAPADLKALMAVRHALEQNWDTPQSNETLASSAGMSLSKFKGLFKQVFGITPYQYHLQYKLDKAKEMLLQQQHSISEVGYLIGYSNLSQFSKAFKKYHGQLPREILGA